MYGEVYVPYTPIGGNNMSRMASNNGTISGSSQNPESGIDQQIVVTWVLPGGISGKGDWHYLLSTDQLSTDDDIRTYLETKGLTDEQAQVNEINIRLFNYVTDLLHAYSFDNFHKQYDSCIYLRRYA